jgi:cytochrome c biogenesis protein CcmG, thiol:disulfide interchange protein DsbE
VQTLQETAARRDYDDIQKRRHNSHLRVRVVPGPAGIGAALPIRPACHSDVHAMLRPRIPGAAAALLLCASAAAEPPPEALQPPPGGVTYVDFWASWCTPCAESLPWLDAMHAKYVKQGLRVVGVSVDTQASKAQRFLEVHPVRFDTLHDPQGRLAELYGVEGMPYAVLIDERGEILHRHAGYHAGKTAEYEQAIRDALAPEVRR